jgi:alkanesulfonate monooxygenase SsuD/methylene tetrahydromethanopterin reductase-like flavin-dependent oxidoreductase (luciferase family)
VGTRQQTTSGFGFADAIVRIEQTGFDSVWIADTINRGYFTLDPLTAAAAVAVITKRIEIGTAVLQVGR